MTESTTTRSPSTPTQRIVVLGGGFAGVTTAQELTRRLRSAGPAGRPATTSREPLGKRQRHSRARSVTLINQDNYFVFQPLLADIISGAIETTHVVVPLRRMLPGVDVEVGTSSRSTRSPARSTSAGASSGRPFTVGYDALVVALGSVTDFRGRAGHDRVRPGRPQPGRRVLPPQPCPVDARGGRARSRSRAAAGAAHVRRGRWRIDRRRGRGGARRPPAHARRTFTSLPEPKVVLVHSRRIVLSEFGDRLGRHATRKLAEAGVQLSSTAARTGRGRPGRARRRDDHHDCDRGQHGRQRATSGGRSPRRSRGRARMDPPGCHVRRPGLDRVWALGRLRVDHRSPDRPADAGDRAARRARRPARGAEHPGGPRRPASRPRSTTASWACWSRSAGSRALAKCSGSRSPGFIAWFLWRTYYLLRLPSRDRRLRVALDWALELFLAHDVVEISMRRSRTMPGEETGRGVGRARLRRCADRRPGRAGAVTA